MRSINERLPHVYNSNTLVANQARIVMTLCITSRHPSLILLYMATETNCDVICFLACDSMNDNAAQRL